LILDGEEYEASGFSLIEKLSFLECAESVAQRRRKEKNMKTSTRSIALYKW